MPELDRLKEEVAYLKFWQGIMVVTELSLIGWVITTTETASPGLWSVAAAGLSSWGMRFSLYIVRSSDASI
jgi:hypothetical protein